MCGRFTLTASPHALKEAFPLFELSDYQPRYNIAPSQQVAAILHRAGATRPECLRLRWGLVPHWADDPKVGYRLINARAETVATKSAFRESFRQRRCLVLADGYYEWQKREDGKQPYYICRRDHRPFAFVGLWDHWEKGEQPIDSCTIITTDAGDFTRPIHDRVPVILDARDYDVWIDPSIKDTEQLQGLLAACPDDVLTAYPISTRVNNPRFDRPECTEPIETDKTPEVLHERSLPDDDDGAGIRLWD